MTHGRQHFPAPQHKEHTLELTTLTDEELDTLRTDVAIEQERRQALATIPGQIADLEAKFLAGGGDPAELRNPA